MKQFAVEEKTFEEFTKVKGVLMQKTGKNPTASEVMNILIRNFNKNGGV
jgi:hypothetical protein